MSSTKSANWFSNLFCFDEPEPSNDNTCTIHAVSSLKKWILGGKRSNQRRRRLTASATLNLQRDKENDSLPPGSCWFQKDQPSSCNHGEYTIVAIVSCIPSLYVIYVRQKRLALRD